MTRLPVLLVVLAGACGGDRTRSAPQASPEVAPAPPTAPPAAAAPPTKVTGWLDFDALPPGAVKRLESQRLVSGSAVVAIRDDGTLALFDELGIIEVRADGKYRVVAPGECAAHDSMRYVGTELRAACGKFLYTVKDGVTTSMASPCGWEESAFSPSGEYLTCGDDKDGVVLVRWPGTVVWRVPVADQALRSLFVTDTGDVAIVEHERMRAVRAGKELWAKPIKLEWSGLGADQTHVVGSIDEPRQLVRIAIADGKQLSVVPMPAHGIARQIAAVPGGGSYFVALYGTYPGAAADTAETFRARIDAKTGKILAAWQGPQYEWGNAVSPNGKLAAAVGVDKVMRIKLDDPAAPVEQSAGIDQPMHLAMSGDNATVAFVTSRMDGKVGFYDVASGKRRAVVPAPEFPEVIELSADGKRAAVAGKFGEFTILDTMTGRALCTAREIQGAKLWWYGSRIVAFYPGDNGDDCDEITEGSITVADDQCRVIKSVSVYGMMELLDTNAARTTVAIADWKNDCGASYELKPWQAFTIDTKTGAKVRAPKLDGEATRREKAAEAAKAAFETAPGDPTPEAVAIADGAFQLSGDGKTRVTMESLDGEANRTRYALRCTDVASKKTLVRHELPKGVGEPYAVSRDGSWVIAADRASVLVFPCRPPTK